MQETGILRKNSGIPKIGDKKSAHQARFPRKRMRELVCARYARVGLSSSVYDVTPKTARKTPADNTDACISPLAASFNGVTLCPALIHYRVSAVTTVLVVGIDSSRTKLQQRNHFDTAF
jgi:hypothetical protein